MSITGNADGLSLSERKLLDIFEHGGFEKYCHDEFSAVISCLAHLPRHSVPRGYCPVDEKEPLRLGDVVIFKRSNTNCYGITNVMFVYQWHGETINMIEACTGDKVLYVYRKITADLTILDDGKIIPT